MGKYIEAEKNIFSVFANPALNIKVVPSSFKGEMGEPPYARLTIVPSGPPLNASSLSGVLLIEIFTAWGSGPQPAFEIADRLDQYLQYSTVGKTQFFCSSMDQQLRDKDNQNLARSIYSLPFAHYGVTK